MKKKLINKVMTIISKIDILEREDDGTLPSLDGIKQQLVSWVNKQRHLNNHRRN